MAKQPELAARLKARRHMAAGVNYGY